MPRKKIPNLVRIVSQDAKYGSTLVETLCNKIMYDGKKSKAQSIVWKTMDLISKNTSRDPLGVFETAINNLTPMYTLKRTKVGGANHQVPVLASQRKGRIAAFKFLILSSRSRGERTFVEKLYKEIVDASNRMGVAFKKLEDHKKMVEANRAFAKI